MGLNLKIEIDNLDKFYREADVVESTGNKSAWRGTDQESNWNWLGVEDRDQIIERKYSYKEGLDQLKQIEDFYVGGSKNKYKYDENDGDDMNFDRFLEGLPSLKKRIKTLGKGNGKFINLHINISENSWCSANSLLIRSYTAMRIIDYLENKGYRIGVYVYADVARIGKYNGTEIDNLHTEIQIKKPDEPLIKPLILTAISPWFFRFWLFKFWQAKFNTFWTLGSSIQKNYEDTSTDLYIKNGECLKPLDAEDRINNIVKFYNEQV